MKLPRLRMRRLTSLGRAVALMAGAASLCCACMATNVVLRRAPDTDTGALGPMQRCDAPEKRCGTDPVQDGSRFTAANTTYFSLPNCQFGIEEILIQNSGSSAAVAVVQCAAPPQAPPAADGGIPTTAPGGGTTSGH
jgi:hypothetical protein